MSETATHELQTDQREREASGARPYGRYLEDFEVGDVYKHWPAKTITEADDHMFCLLTMNHHPLHINDVYASQSQQGQNVVVGPAGLLDHARHVGRRRLRQGDRQPGHRGALAPGAGVPRRHAVRGVRGARGHARRAPSPTAAWSRSRPTRTSRTGRSSRRSSGRSSCRAATPASSRQSPGSCLAPAPGAMVQLPLWRRTAAPLRRGLPAEGKSGRNERARRAELARLRASRSPLRSPSGCARSSADAEAAADAIRHEAEQDAQARRRPPRPRR